MSKRAKRRRVLKATQVVTISFALVILCGTLLLMLPISSVSGESCGWLTALFTSTSATCVTGLILVDTLSAWTLFGQIVILVLIQIGGLGFMSIIFLMALLVRRKLSLSQRLMAVSNFNLNDMSDVAKLVRSALATTFVFEGIGALILTVSFWPRYGVNAIWKAVFTAISAFCNAGFDLMGIRQQYSSLTSFVGDPFVNFAIMALIVIGGIGFMTWDDIKTNGLKWKRYRMQSKVILTTTALLILIPAAYFFFFEFSDAPLNERIWSSFFQSVTPRTAGFNTVDLTTISETGCMIMIALMLIGGSPGSTAGGMKTTTFAVMLSNAVSVFRRREHTHFFGRRISSDTLRNAATIFTMYVTLCLVGGCAISYMENLPLVTCLYETASAVGTVGLTLGITPELGLPSQYILIFLMYVGRVGGLTLIFAALTGGRDVSVRLPQEKLTVG